MSFCARSSREGFGSVVGSSGTVASVVVAGESVASVVVSSSSPDLLLTMNTSAMTAMARTTTVRTGRPYPVNFRCQAAAARLRSRRLRFGVSVWFSDRQQLHGRRADEANGARRKLSRRTDVCATPGGGHTGSAVGVRHRQSAPWVGPNGLEPTITTNGGLTNPARTEKNFDNGTAGGGPAGPGDGG
jgi:hypothetical protein